MKVGNSLQNLNYNIFPNILGAEKPIKRHKPQGERGRAS